MFVNNLKITNILNNLNNVGKALKLSLSYKLKNSSMFKQTKISHKITIIK